MENVSEGHFGTPFMWYESCGDVWGLVSVGKGVLE